MFLTKLYNVDYKGYQDKVIKYKLHKCTVCGATPAVISEADCHGDSEGPYCREHWEQWFRHDLLPVFDTDEIAEMNKRYIEEYKSDAINVLVEENPETALDTGSQTRYNKEDN